MDDIDVIISAEESLQKQWEPEPLYISVPEPLYEEREEEDEEGGCVIIIDIAGEDEEKLLLYFSPRCFSYEYCRRAFFLLLYFQTQSLGRSEPYLGRPYPF